MDSKMREMFGNDGKQKQENTLEIMTDLLLLSSIFFLSVNLNPWNYISAKQKECIGGLVYALLPATIM